MVNHFVARIDDGAEGNVHGFADADGDEDFAFRFVADMEMFCDAGSDGLAQFEQSQN